MKSEKEKIEKWRAYSQKILEVFAENELLE